MKNSQATAQNLTTYSPSIIHLFCLHSVKYTCYIKMILMEVTDHIRCIMLFEKSLADLEL